MRAVLGMIFNKWVLGAIGVAAICLLIWYAGPLIGFGAPGSPDAFRPLESAWLRELLIWIVIAVFVLHVVWRLVMAARSNQKLMESLLGSGPKKDAPRGVGTEEVALLGKRFEQAAQVLKKARFGDRSALSSLVGRQYVYELPWYVIIGAPGSGKTTALMNAGLQFPLAEQLGKDAVRGVGGTRNCDWWFTNQAVLLDTAGRYATQESNRDTDGAEWVGFLRLLRKYRPRRPINGVMLAISVAEVLEQSSAQREAHAGKLRQRIQELHEHIGIRFPIYVLVTKIDLLAGFMEFFGALGKEERAQVWGVTFPLADGADRPLAHLDGELTLLDQRINDQLIEHMEREREPLQRAASYLFPQQWAVAKQTLRDFLDQVFSPSRFEERPMVRGVYFTSGTQEGMPIDRVIGAMGRSLGLARRAPATHQPGGKSFFLTRLLQEVIFRESGLAGTNLKWERQRTLIQIGVTVGVLVVSALVVALWSASFARNKGYLNDVSTKLDVARKDIAGVQGNQTTNVATLVPLLESVRDLANASRVPGEGPPLTMGFGLFQGDRLASDAQIAYRRLLLDAFLPRIALRIEELVRAGGQSNPELLYEALKTYVMLHDPKHFNAKAVKEFVALDWELNLPRDTPVETRNALESHLDTLIGTGEMSAAHRADARLLAGARDAVARTPLAMRVYNRLKRGGIGDKLPEFTIARVAGSGALAVFRRASGQPLTKGIPGLYTYDGYHKVFNRAVDDVAKQLASEEPWVLGVGGAGLGGAIARLDLSARDRAGDDVRRLYLEDYTRQWRAFIDDIQLVLGTKLDENIQVARILSSQVESPLRILFTAIAKEVTLSPVEDPAAKSLLDKGVEKLQGGVDDFRRRLATAGGPAVTAPAGASMVEQLVDAKFEDLRRMVRGAAPGQPTQLDATLGLMNEIYTMLLQQQTALKEKTAPQRSEIPQKVQAEAGRVPEPLRSMMTRLSAAGATLVQREVRDNIGQALRSELWEFCNKATGQRYPFSRSAQQEVTQEDFATLFSSGGKFDEFFQKHLAQAVDTSTRPAWSFRKQGDATVAQFSSALPQFQRAAGIRDAFFRSGGKVPGMTITFNPSEIDTSIKVFTLDVDGQVVRNIHGPPRPATIKWPGSGGTMQVRLSIDPPAASGTSAQTYSGMWALFRAFDGARIESTAQPEKFIVTFNVEGRKASFEVTTSSVVNPFRMREIEQFQCPAGL